MCDDRACAPVSHLTSPPPTGSGLKRSLRQRSSPQKHVWRAKIILMTDEGLGTVAIMEATGKSKTCVWRWQERFMAEGSTAFCATRAGRPALRRLRPNWSTRSSR